MDAHSDEVTQALIDWSRGDGAALDTLLPRVYEELHNLARRSLQRERPDHTLQTTALVHEAYLRLVDQRHVDLQHRAHFFAVAAQVMRRVLVDHARRHGAAKRGSGAMRLPLDEGAAQVPSLDLDLVALDAALERLVELDPRQGRVIELRFYGGLTIEETAAVLNVSPATVKNEWRSARAWLFNELCGGHVEGEP
jgi:RNA polymerase sigma factor (TIGR02999 family)